MKTIAERIAEELGVQERQVQAAIALLDDGATVPFISRYRKELTGGLDDTQLRTLEERLRYLREMDERRTAILNSIREQDKLTPELEQAILEADTKTRLEDLYLPYKPKRRTKAQIAKEAGLEPLAHTLWQNPTQDPEIIAATFINAEKGINDTKQALDGARQILMEQFSEDAELLGKLRIFMWENIKLTSKVIEGKQTEGAKFSDYFDYREPLKEIPSHRALALFRGRNEGFLQLTLPLTEEEEATTPASRQLNACEAMIAQHYQIADQSRMADKWLQETVRWTWRFKVRLSLDVELLMRLRETAETEAIKVFSQNLNDLLLAAPAGQRATMGLDPGLRTGVKVAIVDNTGKLVDHTAIYPHPPKNQWTESLAILAKLAEKYNVELISIGNGTASRETDRLAMDLIKAHPELRLTKIVVSEAGASVYSASELAANEFPDLDVTIRGAVSIARRLQDPLAELVKIEPKSIGVGQYQHDVNQTQLARTLDAVVEDCVNAVGVDVNTASVPLLSRVSGLNAGLAKNIVAFRDEHGSFTNRDMLRKIPRFGEKTFEQAAGFLRVMNGENPLDASTVHPEAYPVIERIVAKTSRPVKNLIGDVPFIRHLKPQDFTDDKFGIPTITDILHELEKPGRDPRPEFKTAEFKEGVETLADLKVDMVLEGVVTNVTNFGAFVDIGVHQDGLVHISALSNNFIKDPREVVKAGDVVKVKVLEIDLARKRVALTMRLNDSGRDSAISASLPKDEKPKSANSDSRTKPTAPAHKPVQKDSKPAKPAKQAVAQPPTALGTALAEAMANARKR
ncbi:Tex family protein [Beggiatoa leptomitoformis]|uniref:S1 RNA-binding domain-containing protein n=1 Tax=Beggiatoa leptomitoformis TaxID=288004 RepID=A0A2N9YFV3_9GAMM|nr:Tex family protein [Beggiatoa leptomitoformis]ALG68299.1 S1 RNA-binding domain-containing protein [Beggiatoa leptomitoformis]AUI69388.1 S1 RNA-binding domain-containing protein [Beggiatoa leptomitoformis]